MLDWYTLFIRATPSNVFIPSHQQVYLIFVRDLRDNEGRRSCIKYGVVGLYSGLQILVIVNQRAYKAGLCCYTPCLLKMIQKERFWWIWLQPGIKLVIFWIIKIKLAPEEIWRSNGIFLASLGPVAASFQTIDDMFGAIAFANCESVVFETNIRVFKGLGFCSCCCC